MSDACGRTAVRPYTERLQKSRVRSGGDILGRHRREDRMQNLSEEIRLTSLASCAG